MRGVFAAWLVGAGLLTWTQGLQKAQWPPPYVYMDLTVFMGLAGLLAQANGTVGGLVAWGSLLGVALADNVFGDVENLAQKLFKAPGGVQPSPPLQSLNSAGRFTGG